MPDSRLFNLTAIKAVAMVLTRRPYIMSVQYTIYAIQSTGISVRHAPVVLNSYLWVRNLGSVSTRSEFPVDLLERGRHRGNNPELCVPGDRQPKAKKDC